MNYTITRIWGIPIRVNISLLVFLPIIVWLIGSGEQLSAYASLINGIAPVSIDTADLSGASDRWIIGVAAAVGLFTSVTLHELGHSWAAMRYDIHVNSITLWILGGLADFAEIPKEWNREFWIAIAGPITSILVGAGCYAALVVVPESATLLLFIVGFLAVMNFILAGFNMLPAFPMDGGRVLRALLARNRPYVSATQTAARIGVWFAVIFAVLGIVVAFSPMLVLLALFIYVAATNESRAVVLDQLLAGLTVEDVRSKSAQIDTGTTLETVVDKLLMDRRTEVAVTENGRIIGAITPSNLRNVAPTDYPTTTAGSIATEELPRLDAADSAVDGLMELKQSGTDVALVEENGQLIGIVSLADFKAVLDVRRGTVAF